VYGNKAVTAAVSAVGTVSAKVLYPPEPQITFLETFPFFFFSFEKKGSKFNMGTGLFETELRPS